MKKIINLIAGLSALGMVSTQAATTYVGNGSAAWGGGVGNASLTVDDNAAGVLTITANNVTVGGNALVIYFDSKSGGFNTTANFADPDNGDGLRKAISGYTAVDNDPDGAGPLPGGPGRSTTLLPFQADFAIGVSSGWGGLWELAENASHPYRATVLAGGFTAGNIMSFNVSDLGLTANSGQSFNFFAMLVSQSGWTSPEFIGASSVSGSNGWGNTQIVGSGSSYTLIPEPSSSLLMGLGLAGLAVLRRVRKNA